MNGDAVSLCLQGFSIVTSVTFYIGLKLYIFIEFPLSKTFFHTHFSNKRQLLVIFVYS